MERNGDDVRDDDPNDRVLEATREHWLAPNILLHAGEIVRYNGKTVVYRPCGYDPSIDAETDDIKAVECAIRRGWLKPYVKPENKPVGKMIGWLASFKKSK